MTKHETELAACTGKDAFRSRAVAERACKSLRKRGKAIRTYKCKCCGSWHVGSNPTVNKRAGAKYDMVVRICSGRQDH